MYTVTVRELFWGDMQYDINGHLNNDKCAWIKEELHQTKSTTSKVLIYFPLHLSFLTYVFLCISLSFFPEGIA